MTAVTNAAPSLPPEEAARAAMYGTLAAWWLGPPTAVQREALVATLQAGGAATDEIGTAWHALSLAAAAASDAQLADEHARLFDSVGRAEILPYASHALTGALHGEPLVRMRERMRALGLAADPRVTSEDHLACQFALMQWLIAGDDPRVANLAQQQAFFRDHLQPWVVPFCDGVLAHPGADVWRHVAALTRAFMRVETLGFDLLASAEDGVGGDAGVSVVGGR